MFLRLMEVLLMAVVIYMVITQLLIPHYYDKPLFPMFRKKSGELEQQLREARQDLEDARTEGKIADIRHRADRVRGLEQVLATANRDLESAKTEGQIEEITRQSVKVRGIESNLAQAREDLATAVQEGELKDIQIQTKQKRVAI